VTDERSDRERGDGEGEREREKEMVFVMLSKESTESVLSTTCLHLQIEIRKVSVDICTAGYGVLCI
jgi:hypothetical protein